MRNLHHSEMCFLWLICCNVVVFPSVVCLFNLNRFLGCLCVHVPSNPPPPFHQAESFSGGNLEYCLFIFWAALLPVRSTPSASFFLVCFVFKWNIPLKCPVSRLVSRRDKLQSTPPAPWCSVKSFSVTLLLTRARPACSGTRCARSWNLHF